MKTTEEPIADGAPINPEDNGQPALYDMFSTDGSNLFPEFVDSIITALRQTHPPQAVSPDLAYAVWEQITRADNAETAQRLATAFVESEDDKGLAQEWKTILGMS